MGPLDPVPEGDVGKNQSGVPPGSPGGDVPVPREQAPPPERLRLQISLEDVPEPISTLFQKLAKPHVESKLRGFVKDYSPVLTPILTAVIAGVVAFYGSRFDDHVSKDTLDKITTEFVSAKGDPNTTAITAMKLAAYGDKALPAVKIALGAKDKNLRDGAVTIAAQMYYGETIDRGDLTEAMLKYYDNPVLRLGVLEWFATVESSPVPLSDKNGKAALVKVRQTFVPSEGKCAEQGKDLAQAAANFLSAAESLAGRKDLALAMDALCPDSFGVHATLKQVLESR
jgi:hypothetical protein